MTRSMARSPRMSHALHAVRMPDPSPRKRERADVELFAHLCRLEAMHTHYLVTLDAFHHHLSSVPPWQPMMRSTREHCEEGIALYKHLAQRCRHTIYAVEDRLRSRFGSRFVWRLHRPILH